MTVALIAVGIVSAVVVGLAVWVAWWDANAQPTKPGLLLARRARRSRRVGAAASARPARVCEENVDIVVQEGGGYPPPATY
jgi:hypothetical protein